MTTMEFIVFSSPKTLWIKTIHCPIRIIKYKKQIQMSFAPHLDKLLQHIITLRITFWLKIKASLHNWVNNARVGEAIMIKKIPFSWFICPPDLHNFSSSMFLLLISWDTACHTHSPYAPNRKSGGHFTLLKWFISSYQPAIC